VADQTAPSERQRPFSRLIAVTAIGSGVALGVGAAVAATGVWRVAIAAPAVIAVIAGVVTRGLPDVGRPHEAAAPADALASVLQSTWIRRVLMLSVCEGALMLGALTFIPAAVAQETDYPKLAGLALGLFAVGALAALAAPHRWTAAWSPSRLLAAGSCLMAAGYGLLAARYQDLASLIAAMLLLGVGYMLLHATMQSWATEIAPDTRGVAVGLFAASLFIGAAACAALAPVLLSRVGYAGFFASVGLAFVVFAWTSTGLRRSYERRLAGQAPCLTTS